MKNPEDKNHIIDLVVNIIFISNLQMNNNYKSVGFRMQRSKDDMLGVSTESIVIFAQSSGIFAQSLELWA